MIETATAPRTAWQTRPAFTHDYELESRSLWSTPHHDVGTDVEAILQGVYRVPTQHAERLGVDAIARRANRDAIIEVKCVANHPRMGFGQWTSSNLTAFPYSDSEPEPMPGAFAFTPEPEQTIFILTSDTEQTVWPDFLVSRYYRNAEAQIQPYRVVRDKSVRRIVVEQAISRRQAESPSVRAIRLIEIDEMLRKFAELPENWDSYGGSPASPVAVEEARTILIGGIDLNLPTPWVAPGGDAGIGIEWNTERGELYIDIVPGEETTYVLTPKAANLHEDDGVLTTGNLTGVLNQLAEPAT